MFRFLTYLILVLLITPIANAEVSRDDDDTTTGLQREVRRLHPERERLKPLASNSSFSTSPGCVVILFIAFPPFY